MQINHYLLTLVYKDNSRWFAGEFSTMEALNAWLDEEKTRPYWDPETQAEITTQIRVVADPEEQE